MRPRNRNLMHRKFLVRILIAHVWRVSEKLAHILAIYSLGRAHLRKKQSSNRNSCAAARVKFQREALTALYERRDQNAARKSLPMCPLCSLFSTSHHPERPESSLALHQSPGYQHHRLRKSLNPQPCSKELEQRYKLLVQREANSGTLDRNRRG